MSRPACWTFREQPVERQEVRAGASENCDYMTITQVYSKGLRLAGGDDVDYYPAEHFAVRRIAYKDIIGVRMNEAGVGKA